MIHFRIIFIIMAAITTFLMLGPLVLGLSSGLLTYHGICYGFTDGSWPCSWREYISEQVFWSGLLEIPLAIYVIPGWLTAIAMWLVRSLVAHANMISLPLVLIIPVGSSLGGTCLFFVIPLLIRWMY